MSPLLFLFGAVLVAALAIGALSFRQRRPTSMNASMREFERGLKALDPSGSNGRHSRRPASEPGTGPPEALRAPDDPLADGSLGGLSG